MYRAKAGNYRQRIAIEAQAETVDDQGLRSVSWGTVMLDSDTPLDAVPAQVLLGSGNEEVLAGAKYDSMTARINFRYVPGVEQKMRIVWDGRRFDIVEISADETGRLELRARCVEGLSDGR